MERGALAPLSPNEEVTLRRIAIGFATASELRGPLQPKQEKQHSGRQRQGWRDRQIPTRLLALRLRSGQALSPGAWVFRSMLLSPTRSNGTG
jgi:hypothetical protein